MAVDSAILALSVGQVLIPTNLLCGALSKRLSMAKVFISYRRADSATFTGRIYDRLIAKFGRKNVFRDVE